MKQNKKSSFPLSVRVLCLVLAGLMVAGAAILTITVLFGGLGL